MNAGKIINEKYAKLAAFTVVTAFSILSAFWAIGFTDIGNHESYVGVTARQMVSSGNWAVPVFNGTPRLNKTPLNYWLTAIGASFAGGVNDFVLRLPSAALAVLSAMAIFYFVSEWLGFRIAALSSLVWSGSLCYMNFTHTGRPEMALAVFVTIAMLSFYSAIESQSRKKQIWYMLIFWISFTLSMYAKGPAPLPLIFPALFFYVAIFRKWNFIPKALPIIGIILFLAAFIPWPLAVFLKCPNAVEIWKREYFDRAAGDYAPGSEPFYYYFKIMFVYATPFCAFIVPALLAPFYKIWEEKRKPLVYLCLWFIVGIVVMSCCGGKRAHYILPMMPAMAIMTAILLDDMLFTNKAYTKKFAAIFLSAHFLVIIAGAITIVFLLLTKGHPAKSLLLYAVAVLACFSVVMAVFYMFNKKFQSMVCLFGGLCVVIIFSPFIDPINPLEKYSTRDFAHRISTNYSADSAIAYCKVSPSFIYYLGRDIKSESDPNMICDSYSADLGVVAMDGLCEQLKKDSRFLLVDSSFTGKFGLFKKLK